MKTKHFTLIALIGMFILGLSACNSLEDPDTDMKVNMWTITDAKFDKDAASVTRARVRLLVSGYHEQPYTLTYTIDGQSGTGLLALHHLPNGDDGANLLTEQFNGNCPSGSSLDIPCYRVNNLTMQYHGATYFLMPLLEPGSHTFVATITNEYGQTIESTHSFTVEGAN
ncbi:MAG: hypothetical protein II858_04525 [Bacteroidales bacterium]|nr:hypothetical protein [Bacteroidales bacterium]